MHRNNDQGAGPLAGGGQNAVLRLSDPEIENRLPAAQLDVRSIHPSRTGPARAWRTQPQGRFEVLAERAAEGKTPPGMGGVLTVSPFLKFCQVWAWPVSRSLRRSRGSFTLQGEPRRRMPSSRDCHSEWLPWRSFLQHGCPRREICCPPRIRGPGFLGVPGIL